MANLTVGILTYGALYKVVSLYSYDRTIALFEEVYPNKSVQSHFGDLVTGKMRWELEKGLGWIRKERFSVPDLILIDNTLRRPRYFRVEGLVEEEDPEGVWLEILDLTKLAADGSLLDGFFTKKYLLYPKEDVEAALQEALSILTTPTLPDWAETGDEVMTVGANDYMTYQERQEYLQQRERRLQVVRKQVKNDFKDHIHVILATSNPLTTRFFRVDGLDEEDPTKVWLEELDSAPLFKNGLENEEVCTEVYEIRPKEEIEAALKEALTVLNTHALPDLVEPQSEDQSKEKAAEVRKLYFNVTEQAATFNLTDDTVIESEEVAPGVILDYGPEGQVVGVELLNVKDLNLRYST